MTPLAHAYATILGQGGIEPDLSIEVGQELARRAVAVSAAMSRPDGSRALYSFRPIGCGMGAAQAIANALRSDWFLARCHGIRIPVGRVQDGFPLPEPGPVRLPRRRLLDRARKIIVATEPFLARVVEVWGPDWRERSRIDDMPFPSFGRPILIGLRRRPDRPPEAAYTDARLWPEGTIVPAGTPLGSVRRRQWVGTCRLIYGPWDPALTKQPPLDLADDLDLRNALVAGTPHTGPKCLHCRT